MPAQLREAIDQAMKTQAELVSATRPGSNYDERELVRLRGRFQKEMLSISHLSSSDSALRAQPDKFAEFNQRHGEIRDQLYRHQAKWMLREIERDWDGYSAATMALRKAQDDFFTWAKTAVV
ncbi:MAG: hypothetical protein V2J51_02775 [Erythrobacter sp.]|jgi:hypothetical protein|nr:hypothetical protein [Erythrobacter sp.]